MENFKKYKAFQKQLSEQELLQQVKLAQEGNKDAKQKVWQHCLGLIVYLLGRTYGTNNTEFDDLVSEASIGVLDAIPKYDFARGVKFTHYVTYWIFQKALTHYRNMSHIHVPSHILCQTNRILKLLKDDNISLSEICNKYGYDQVAVEHNINCIKVPTSLNKRINENEDLPSELQDTIADDKVDDQMKILSTFIYKENIEKALESLEPRERYIIIMRYGLDGKGAQTLKECANLLNLSRERIRQIQQKAEMKMRMNENLQKLVA